MKDWYRLIGGSHSRAEKGKPVEIEVRGGPPKLTLKKGDVFEPTEFEKATIGDKLKRLNEEPGAAAGPGAKFVWHGLPMTSEGAVVAAINLEVDPAKLGAEEPAGKTGYTVKQIRALAGEGPADDDDEESEEAE